MPYLIQDLANSWVHLKPVTAEKFSKGQVDQLRFQRHGSTTKDI